MTTDQVLQKLSRLLSHLLAISEDDRDINILSSEVASSLYELFNATFVGIFRLQAAGNGLSLLGSRGTPQSGPPLAEDILASINLFGTMQSNVQLRSSFLPLFPLLWTAKDPFAPQSRVDFIGLVALKENEGDDHIDGTIALVEPWLSQLFSRHLAKSRLDRRLDFLRHLTEIPGTDIDRVFSTLLDSFTQAVPSRFIDLWLYNELDDTLAIRSFAPAVLDGNSVLFSHFDSQVLKRTECLTGEVIQTGRPTSFPNLKTPFRNPRFAKRLGLDWLISLPLNDATAGKPLGILNIWPEGSPNDFSQTTLELLTAYVAPVSAAVRLSYLLFQESLVAAYDELFQRMLEFSDHEDWWNDLALLVRDHMRCEGCSIFLRGKDDLLYPKGTTGLEKPHNNLPYRLGQGLTGTTFATAKPLIYHIEFSEEFQNIHRSLHREMTTDKSKSILLVPILGASGRVDGVLRCNNKKEVPARQVGRFTQEDLAHLQQIAKLISNLQSRALWLRTREEERSRAITSLCHELKAPVANFSRHTEWMRKFTPEIFAGPLGSKLRLKLDDMHRQSELLSLLVSNITDIDEIALDPTELQARQFIERCLNCVYDEAKYSQITFQTGEIGIRRLYCDERHMTRALFNLVRNAVKYCDRTELSRYVAISAKEEDGNWVIGVRDNGIGVPPGDEEIIFFQLKRGSNAASVYPQGTGLGLYFCKQIAEAHGGGIRLARPSKPTQFEIFWPARPRKD